jgi:16S rRNA processing protein RimM
MAKIRYPECGRIVNTHGCHGAVKVEAWCDSPEVFAALPAVYLKKNGEYERVALKKASVFKQFVFAELAGVDTMEKADALRGTVLYAHRDDLGIPDGVMLIAEIIGLPVTHAETGKRLGVVADVIHPASNDIYVIRTPDGGEAMVPAVPAFVKEISEQGLLLTPIEGMFE